MTGSNELFDLEEEINLYKSLLFAKQIELAALTKKAIETPPKYLKCFNKRYKNKEFELFEINRVLLKLTAKRNKISFFTGICK